MVDLPPARPHPFWSAGEPDPDAVEIPAPPDRPHPFWDGAEPPPSLPPNRPHPFWGDGDPPANRPAARSHPFWDARNIPPNPALARPRPFWPHAPQTGNQRPAIAYTANADFALYTWGTIQFKVWPLNMHEYDHSTATDWAKKEIAGAAIYREWVGENDEELFIRGRVYPFRIGGLSNLDAMEEQRRKGVSALMVRGDGTVMGWFCIERLVRSHEYLFINGIGQQITFEAVFVRVPVPPAEDEYPVFWQLGNAA